MYFIANQQKMNATKESKILYGEYLPKKISIQDYLKEAIENSDPHTDICKFMLEHGQKFNERFNEHPEKIINLGPQMKNAKCHGNSMFYSFMIGVKQPYLLKKINFVTGFYAVSAKGVVLDHNEHAIVHHSFLTYEGKVFDCTSLVFKPNLYDITEYFGVSFSLETVNNVLGKLFGDFSPNESSENPIPPIMILKDEPCLAPT